MKNLKQLKRDRSIIGSWFLGSWLSCIIILVHAIRMMDSLNLTNAQIVMITIYVANNIISTLAVVDINSEIKKIQGHI